MGFKTSWQRCERNLRNCTQFFRNIAQKIICLLYIFRKKYDSQKLNIPNIPFDSQSYHLKERKKALFQHIQGSKMFTYGVRCVCIKMKTATVFNEKCFSEN